MENKFAFEVYFQYLLAHYYRALHVLQAKKYENVNADKTTSLTIRIVNPNEECNGKNKNHYRVFISVNTLTNGTLNMEKGYDKTLKLPIRKGIDEEVLKKFIRYIMAYNEITKVSNFMNSEFYFKAINEMFMCVAITFGSDIILQTPKNDVNYLDVIVEASNKSLIKNFKFLEFAVEHGHEAEGYVKDNYGCADTITYCNYLVEKAQKSGLNCFEHAYLINFYEEVQKHKSIIERGSMQNRKKYAETPIKTEKTADC